MTDGVSARAQYWNPLLWDYATKTIRKAFVQEQMGGQWVTFAAAWHPGDHGPQTYMATEAWRLCSAPPVIPPTPAPTPADSPVQHAASAMNAALLAHGYKQIDQPVYKAFQAAAGLTADGFPGTNTMHALASVLQSMGQTIAPVKVYPWHTMPGQTGYDGSNAPTWAEWTGAAAPAPIPAPASMQAPGPVLPYPGSGAWQSNGAYITRYQQALSYLSVAMGQPTWNPGKVDGKYGPNTGGAVRAFQAAQGLTVDGKAGQDTAAALDALVQANPPAAAHH